MLFPPSQTPEAMIRVNQAGEFGAVQIYRGQLKILKGTDLEPVLKEMIAHEEEHLQAFNDLMQDRRIRPTLLSPLWRVAGYALGAGTALLGKKTALLCTVAVEEVIDKHYQKQLDVLEHHPQESALKSKIAQFRGEELAHKDIGLQLGAREAFAHRPLSFFIKGASRLAIWLSSRL